MRIRFLAPAIVGGLIAGAASAAPTAPASPPPSAPIFYCPATSGPGPAPAPASAASHPRGGHVSHAAARGHGAGCPTARIAHAGGAGHVRVGFRGRDGHGRDHMRVASRDDRDVSASQAFIYRYERAMHGLNPQAAAQAWDHRPSGPPPHQPPPPRVGPPAHGPDDMADGHMGRPDRDGRAFAYQDHQRMEGHMAPPPPMPPPPRTGPPPGRGDHAYAYEEHGGGALGHMRHGFEGGRAYSYEEHGSTAGGGHYGYLYERREQRGSTGWSYSQGGGVHGEHWSGGGDSMHGDSHGWAYGGGRQVWAGHGYHAGDGQWEDGSYGDVYQYASRDAHGYLIWPGKTPAAPTRDR